MPTLKPLAALRANPKYAQKIAALPYDVYSTEEARALAKDNPYSFLHVDKSEIDLPDGVDLYDDSVYAKAGANLQKMVSDGLLENCKNDAYYVYEMQMGDRVQTGVIGLAAIDDYVNGSIKRHELTRADKEADRIRHIKACGAQTGLIFLAYKENNKKLKDALTQAKTNPPLYDLTFEDGVTSRVYEISDGDTIALMRNAFDGMENFYIADGHHRNAAAVNIGLERRAQNPQKNDADAPHNYYICAAFDASELLIMDYNRVIKDLNGLTPAEFMSELTKHFTVTESGEYIKPAKHHDFSMYLGGKWHVLSLKKEKAGSDTLENLDVSVLQNLVIEPILGISDVRNDKRIDFIGGIRGHKELENRINSGEMAVGFMMYPTSMDELMTIADQGLIMPPKSTWFEPKLRSGLVSWKIEDNN